MRIQNGVLMTIENGRFENGYVDFENGVITAFGDMAQAAPYDGEVFDAQGGWIMPPSSICPSSSSSCIKVIRLWL